MQFINEREAVQPLFKKDETLAKYYYQGKGHLLNICTSTATGNLTTMPPESRLLPAQDRYNDGNLTVFKVCDLRLNADMVVLSACQINLGKGRNGDDVIGLNCGFLFAGAKSIVGSLWMVPDKPTKDLMMTFYKNLQSTDVRSAMQRAQLAIKKKDRHPSAWAAFQLVGGA